MTLGHNLDLVQNNSKKSPIERETWRRAELALSMLLTRISDSTYRAAVIKKLFSEGRSLGWLVSILRGEISAQGHYDQNSRLPDQCLLNAEEFEGVLSIMIRRFYETSPETIMNTPRLLSLLFCWQQGSKNNDAVEWVKRNTVSDEQFIDFLSKVRGYRCGTNYGVQHPLVRSDLKIFIDCDQSLSRVREISKREDAPSQLKALAQELLEAFAQGGVD